MVNFGFGGHFGSFSCSGVNFGQFHVRESLLVHFGFVGHFGSIMGLGSLWVNFGFGSDFWSILGSWVTLGPLWVLGSL